MTDGGNHDHLLRAARAAGLDRHGEPSLRDVERRRAQLLSVAFLTMVALALALAAVSAGTAVRDVRTWFAELPVLRVAVVLLVLGLVAYVVEKEAQLRRLTWLLVGERQLSASLAHEAYHDPLTGLLNRRAFTESLERALARARLGQLSVGVLFLDLDHFKDVNDAFGHQVGDCVLAQVGKRLQACAGGRDGDVVVARFEGDEFTILVEGTDGADGPVELARRVVEELAVPVDVGDEQVVVSASVGVSVCVGGRGTPADVLRQADLAMYLAKERGRAGFELFRPGMIPTVGQLRPATPVPGPVLGSVASGTSARPAAG